MSRWDYDTAFYRVFCIALLGVALTFTVILTNVFVDIDSILADRKGTNLPSTKAPDFLNPKKDDESEDFYENKDYQDSSDLYRSKRSLDPQDLLFKIKDPNVKRILTHRLNTLLDELDEEESTKNDEVTINSKKTNKKPKKFRKDIEDSEDNNGFIKTHDVLNTDEQENVEKSIAKDNEPKVVIDKVGNTNQLLHLAMHNVILQGIIGNMKMDSVYKKIQDLVSDFEKHKIEEPLGKTKTKETHQDKAENPQEIKLFDEILNCKDLQEQIITKSTKAIENDDILKIRNESNGKHQDPKVMIKTIIDITEPNDKAHSDGISNSKLNLNGIVKLIYNGKTIRFKRIDEPSTPSDLLNPPSSERSVTKSIEKKDDPDVSFKKLFENYLKKISEKQESAEHGKIYTRKRLKRHIKIRYDNPTTAKPKQKEDDELFVEIETHFDSHGTKGEKKKKIIRELIDKIKQAIHSDPVTKRPKHVHVRKRTQNRLDNIAFVNTVLAPLEHVNHRHSDPITKLIITHEKAPWLEEDHDRKQSPGFFVKRINSAELGTVETDYNKVNTNGIPQRLQIPINNEFSDETLSGQNALDLGNIKFLVKDIEGSGFSIGFNQFQGESPDPESMKLFMGLENVLQTYHQQYDQEVTDAPKSNDYDENSNYYDRMIENADINRYNDNIGRNNDNVDARNHNDDQNTDHELHNRQTEHIISRRSVSAINKSHHHLNEYKDIFNKDFLPYENYEDITNKGDKTFKKKNEYIKLNSLKGSVLVIDENIFNKDLKPAEIFTIADLLARQKRSIKVEKFIRSQKKLNRFINTHSIARKRLFKNNRKRSKRQIGKIRIVARNSMNPHRRRNSEEDIFMVSDEKIYEDRAVFADRAVLTELVPERGEKLPVSEYYDIISPHKKDNHFDIIREQKNDDFEVRSYEDQNPYSPTITLNSLMSKYPHIIMEEASKEETFVPYRRSGDPIEDVESTTVMGDIIPLSDLMPEARANFKVTVKIKPKNITTHGFKEVHTSINKSYNKNGMLYTSLVNVSEVSKVEKLRRNSTRSGDGMNFKEQQDVLKNLITEHKIRIEEQLKHLNNEKRKLDEINVANVEPEDTKTNTISTTEKTTETAKVIDTTAITTTTKRPTSTTEISTTRDPDKLKLINKMEHNEKLTSEILRRIDRNTGLLETFLDKILKTVIVAETTTFKQETKNNVVDLKAQYENLKNSSNGIPFVYAYHHPHNPKNSIIYQGQIHTNFDTTNDTNMYVKPGSVLKTKVDDKENFFQPKPGEMVINNYKLKNNTRFYLDPIRDFVPKMFSLAPKTHIYNTPYSLPNNGTRII